MKNFEIKKKRKEIKMNFVRARNAANKLEIRDNRLFAIDVELMREGFKVYFMDSLNGERHEVNYDRRSSFDKEWEIFDGMSEEELIFERMNGYQE